MLEGACHDFFAAVAGQHDNLRPRPSLAHALQHRQSVTPAEPVVGYHDIAAAALEMLSQQRRGISRQYLCARKGPLQAGLNNHPVGTIVFDQQKNIPENPRADAWNSGAIPMPTRCVAIAEK